jgi:hypothetical protein
MSWQRGIVVSSPHVTEVIGAYGGHQIESRQDIGW